jgi:hypothetical protein
MPGFLSLKSKARTTGLGFEYGRIFHNSAKFLLLVFSFVVFIGFFLTKLNPSQSCPFEGGEVRGRKTLARQKAT